MNYFADLVGLHDPDTEKAAHVTHEIWRDYYGHLLPKRLEVSYGSGKEFKNDKLWHQKMECNVAEALIGALHAAKLEGALAAANALCFLCCILPSRDILPSNWSMAERTIAVKNSEFFDVEFLKLVQDFMDVNLFVDHMEQCLGCDCSM